MRTTILLAFFAIACSRGSLVPPAVDAGEGTDLATAPRVDAALSSDQATAPDLGLPCIAGNPSECAYAYGTEGCPPGYCRGEPIPSVPDLWSAGCAEWGDGGKDGACP